MFGEVEYAAQLCNEILPEDSQIRPEEIEDVTTFEELFDQDYIQKNYISIDEVMRILRANGKVV